MKDDFWFLSVAIFIKSIKIMTLLYQASWSFCLKLPPTSSFWPLNSEMALCCWSPITTYSVSSQPIPTHNHFLLNLTTSTVLLHGFSHILPQLSSYNTANITSMNRNWIFAAPLRTRFYFVYSKGFCYLFPWKVINQTSQITAVIVLFTDWRRIISKHYNVTKCKYSIHTKEILIKGN